MGSSFEEERPAETNSLLDDLDGLSKEEVADLEKMLDATDVKGLPTPAPYEHFETIIGEPEPASKLSAAEEDAKPKEPTRSPMVTTYENFVGSNDGSADEHEGDDLKSPADSNDPLASAVSPRTSIPVPSRMSSPEKGPIHGIIAEQPMGPGRKLSDAFSWLSRKASMSVTSAKSVSPSPTTLGRSITNMSTVSVAAEDSPVEEHRPMRSRSQTFSLQDRFKIVRLREEANVDLGAIDKENASDFSQSDMGSSPSSPINGTVEHHSKQDSGSSDETILSPAIVTSPGAVPPFAGSEGPVDWDLWQQVVYEGPTAVSRQSPEALEEAIAKGIPTAIRGVVWQVLAQSKNDDLEGVYRELVARQAHPQRSRRGSGLSIKIPSFRSQDVSPVRSDRSRRKDSVSSFASSVRSTSETSRSRSSTRVSAVASPGTSIDDAMAAKVQHNLEDRDRKSQEELIALQKLEKTIKRDLGARTSYSKFLMSAGLQDGLFGVCKAYALYDEAVGYAQGMNFIAMPLLFNMPEEEAFCLFVRLMNKYKLRDMFVEGMPGLHLHLYQFERLLEDLAPAVYCHLHRRGVNPIMYATQWFLTLFAYRFPLQLVVRIYDLILSEGLEGAIVKFGIALMQKNASRILELKDMAVLSSFLKEGLFDVYIDKSPSQSSILESGFFGRASGVDKQVYRADELVRDATAVPVTPAILTQYAREWTTKVQEEKTKQAEDEALRASNASLSLQVKTLQDRVEKSDVEHVQVASELVRVKVENDRVYDEVEGLRQQVEDLRNIIQSQPNEVEGKLKQEMDRIMKRNIEVQEENRSLEDSVADMEKELVKAKMLNAEISGELDNMRQKWNAVTSMMHNKT